MGQVISMGVTGSKAKFTVDLPKHTLSFNTKVRFSRSHIKKFPSYNVLHLYI